MQNQLSAPLLIVKKEVVKINEPWGFQDRERDASWCMEETNSIRLPDASCCCCLEQDSLQACKRTQFMLVFLVV